MDKFDKLSNTFYAEVSSAEETRVRNQLEKIRSASDEEQFLEAGKELQKLGVPSEKVLHIKKLAIVLESASYECKMWEGFEKDPLWLFQNTPLKRITQLHVVGRSFYTKGREVQMQMTFHPGFNYYIVPSTFEINQFGSFSLDIVTDGLLTVVIQPTLESLPWWQLQLPSKTTPVPARMCNPEPFRTEHVQVLEDENGGENKRFLYDLLEKKHSSECKFSPSEEGIS